MKLLTVIVCLALAWGTAGFAFLQHEPDVTLAERIFKTGEQLYDEGKYKLAADTFKVAAAIFEKAKQPVDLIKATNLQAECLSNLNQCDAAAPLLQRSMDIASGLGNKELADTYYYLSRNTGGCARKWDEAIKLMQRSLDLKKELYEEGDLAFSDNYNFLGYIYNSKGKYDSALIFLDQAMSIRAKNLKPGDIEQSHTMFNLAASYEGKSQLGKALVLNLDALKIRTEKLGTMHATVSNSINSIGRIYRKLGNNERALEYYRQALDIRKKTLGENHPNVAASYYEIGNLYGNISNYHASLEYVHEGNRILESNTQIVNDVLPTYFAYEGKMYGLTGRHNEAKAMIAKAVSVAEQRLSPEHPYRAIVYNIAGEYFGEAGDVDQQSTFFNKAIAIYQKSFGPGSEREADIISKMAATHSKLGNYADAGKLYNEALSIYTTKLGTQNPKVATIHLGIGDVYSGMHQRREALSAYEHALASIAGTENKHLEFRILRGKARNETGITSLHTYELALNIADEIAQGYTNDAARVDLEKQRREVCEEALAIAEQLSMTPEAFAIAERSKSVLLLENARDQQAKTMAGVPDSLVDKERDLRIELAYYRTSLYQSQKTKDTAAASIFEKNIFAAERNLETFKSHLEERFPSYYKLKYRKSVPTLAGVQEVLPDNTTLVQYFVSDSAIYSFTITNNSAQLKRQAITDGLENIIAGYQKSLTDLSFIMNEPSRADSMYSSTARSLFTLLALPEKAGQKIIIVPDDFLAQLNFGTLLYGDDTYFNRNTISYAYSSTFLVDHARAEKRWNAHFAGFAPSYESGDYTSIDSSAHPMTALAMRSGNLPLPGAAEEVNLISKMMDGESWLNEEATETNFKNFSGDYDVLHLAMHSLLNHEEPRYSELLFNPRNDTANDGYLTVAEIYNLKLNAQMVVLSSCSSGFGKIQYGEGPISLSRAFSYAGCPSVIMSLWKVPDLVTTSIMKNFYENLSDGLAKDEALRQAQLTFTKENTDPLYRHPYYWAGFVVIGDTKPLQTSRPYATFLIAGLFVVGIGVLIFKSRK